MKKNIWIILQRGLIILIIGGALLVVGSVVLNMISIDVRDKFSSVVLLIPDQRIEPQTSFTAAFDLFLVEDSTLAIASRTPNSFLSMKLADIEGQVIEDIAFDDKLLVPLDKFQTGKYQLTITNFGHTTATVNAVIVPSPILEQLEDFLDLAYNTLAASTAIFAGLVICVVGAIILFRDKRKYNNL